MDNVGLPTYVAMERKPENGCEIQNCYDGKSGIMLQLCVFSPVKQMLKKVMMT
jgi:hypothetical protein